MNYTQWFAQNGHFNKAEQWLVPNLMLETITGSRAYSCETEDSDYDLTAIVLPKHEHLFPQQYGFILGFDQLPNFTRKELKGKKIMIGDKPFESEWISLIEFFVHAGLKASPNLVEVLFVRRELVTVGTKAGWLLRDNRKLFLSLRTFHAFKGFACGQMHRIRTRKPETEERQKIIEKYHYDIKMAYQTLRLLNQTEQILTDGDLDLQRNKEEHKLMRKGEWGDFDRFDKEFQKRMDYVEELSRKCNLPPQPQAGALKKLLNEILEEHYSSEAVRVRNDEYVSAKDIGDKFDKIITMLKIRGKYGAIK
jgi:predicted nucleotidyltransferase